MNKLTKIGLTALAGSLISVSAHAGSMSVSGGATLSISDSDVDNTQATTAEGNQWSMGDSLTFTGSGDMDNGMSISVSFEVDNDDTGGGEVYDSHSMTLDTNGMGTITFAGHGGDSAMSAIDDKTPNAYEESWDIVTGADGSVVNGVSGNGSFMYTSPSVSGATVMVAYINASDAVTDNSYMDFGITLSPEMIEGLSVGYATGDDESTTGTVVSDSTMYATYAYGSATVGFQRGNADSNQGTNDISTTGIAISYQVTDDLAISYGENTVDFESTSKVDQEASGVSISYTMGSMSLSGGMNTVDNIGGTTTADKEGYEFALGFAF